MRRLLIGLVFCSIQVRAEVRLIEAYGDSLTQGLFSHSTIEKPDKKEIANTLRDFSMFYLTKDQVHIKQYLRPDLSWVSEVARRLGEAYGLKQAVPVRNRAVFGSVAKDLIKQVSREWPEYNEVLAFFLIGHNEICDVVGTEAEYVAKFRREYLEALHAWDRTHQGSTALLIPMLPVHQAYLRMHEYVWYQEKNEKLTCTKLWQLFGYCPKFTTWTKQGKIESSIAPIENALNQELKYIASEMTFSTKSGNQFLTLDPTLFSKPTLGAEFYAYDCYHPSLTGQKAVAGAVYRATFERP